MRSISIISLIATGLGASLLSLSVPAADDTTGRDDGVFQLRVRAVYLDPHRPVLGPSNTLGAKVYPELSGEWFLAPGWSTELALGVPTFFRLASSDSIRLMPNTWTAKYEFAPQSNFRPYLGAGLHYTRLALKTSVGVHDGIDGSSTGWVAQVGVDARAAPNWFVNADVRYLGHLEPDAVLAGFRFPGLVYKIDPFLISLGVSYRWR